MSESFDVHTHRERPEQGSSFKQEKGEQATESSSIRRRNRQEIAKHAEKPVAIVPTENQMFTQQQQKKVQEAETKKNKIAIRVISGLSMMACFMVILWMGHLYICALVSLCEILLFRELVKVRYHVHFDTIQDTIPLFRTTQWLWFSVAIFYTYGDFILEIIQNNTNLHYLLTRSSFFSGESMFPGMIPGLQTSLPSIAFCLYSCTFVLTITTLQNGHIKFQLNQLCWTIVVLCLTVGQLKYIMHNIYNGLIWFVLPILLVITNDCWAYICGMTCGRKFIRREFTYLSPNKTWEGFIGACIFTMIFSWYFSKFFSQSKWFTCPTNEFRLFPESLECEVHPLFEEAQYILPSQMFELLPPWIVKMIPDVSEICSIKQSADIVSNNIIGIATTVKPELTRCVSGEESHVHHHFLLVLKNVYPMQMHALWLALFASLVAPFGGFLASAIKRAYGIKDFDSIIPGHGGMMDRFDCQFLMALYTWVHYNTFVKLATISVPKLVYMYSLLSENEKIQFLDHISKQ